MTRCAYCTTQLNSTTKGDLCATCRRVQGQEPPGPEHALRGGRWVNDRGIQRWVTA